MILNRKESVVISTHSTIVPKLCPFKVKNNLKRLYDKCIPNELRSYNFLSILDL